MKKGIILILLIVLSGLAIRVIGIDFGLPSICHNDESIIVNYALAYGKGDFNPHFFKVPPFLSYCLFFLYGCFYIIGRVGGMFSGINDFGYRFLSDPTYFYLIGRIFTGVFFGTFSIFILYKLGQRIFDKQTGIIAALFLAFNFMHVRDSHYIYFDVPLVFFMLLFFLVLYVLFSKNLFRHYLICGLVLGVAISAKYSAGTLVLPALIITLRNKYVFKDNWKRFIGKNLLAISGVLVGLFLTNPFMFLDYGYFFTTIWRMPVFNPGLWYHINVSLLGACGLFMCVAGAIGMLFAIKRKSFFGSTLIAYSVFYYYIITRSSQMAERYVFPVLPIVLLFAAYAVKILIDKTRGSRAKMLFGTSLCLVLLLPSLTKIYYSDRLFAAEDTRTQSYNWIMENIPDSTVIALDATGPLSPILPQDRMLIKKSMEEFDNPKFDVPQGALNYKVRLILENPYYPEKVFYIYYLRREPSEDRFLTTYPEVFLDIDDIKDKDIEYVVVNSLVRNNTGKKFLPILGQNAHIIKEFSPYKEGVTRTSPVESSVVPGIPFSYEELSERVRPGPIIRIYKLKK